MNSTWISILLLIKIIEKVYLIEELSIDILINKIDLRY